MAVYEHTKYSVLNVLYSVLLYMCISVGAYTVLCTELPRAPFDVRLVSCSARVVQLEWKHTSSDVSNASVTSSAALQFIIEYNTSFQPDTWQVCHVTHLAGARQSVISLALRVVERVLSQRS